MGVYVHSSPTARLPEMGSPALHGTWLDESLNKKLRSVSQAAHKWVWRFRVLHEFNKLEKGDAKKRKLV